MCHATKVLLLIMDNMIFLASISDEEIDDFEKLNALYQRTWWSLYRNVLPKTHSKYHLIEFLKKIHGMEIQNERASRGLTQKNKKPPKVCWSF
jgi:hypothetical protein